MTSPELGFLGITSASVAVLSEIPLSDKTPITIALVMLAAFAIWSSARTAERLARSIDGLAAAQRAVAEKQSRANALLARMKCAREVISEGELLVSDAGDPDHHRDGALR